MRIDGTENIENSTCLGASDQRSREGQVIVRSTSEDSTEEKIRHEEESCKLYSKFTSDCSHQVVNIYSRCISRKKGLSQHRQKQIKEEENHERQ